MPHHNIHARRERRKAAHLAAMAEEEIGATDQEDITKMEVDEESGPASDLETGSESSNTNMNADAADEMALTETTAPINAGTTTTSPTGPIYPADPTDPTDPANPNDPNDPNDPFNMAEIRRALEAVQQQSTRENLDAAAIFHIHQFVETSWDDTFNHRAEVNQVLLTQLAHVRALSRRVDASSSAAFPPAFPAPSPATNSPFAAAALLGNPQPASPPSRRW